MPAKAALITGAAHRIGRALALGLAQDGTKIAVHYNQSREAAEQLAAEIGNGALSLGADLRDESQFETLIARATDALGPIDLLINNASLFEYDSALSATKASWDAHMTANLRAPFVLSQHFAQQLPEDSEGLIVNLLDQRVWALTPHFTSYTVSKTGLWTLTQTLAQALAPRIRVNAIGPGPTLKNSRQSDEHFARQQQGVILKRGAELSEFVEAVRFMGEARSMTGQMIALDGGQHLGWETPDIQGIDE